MESLESKIDVFLGLKDKIEGLPMDLEPLLIDRHFDSILDETVSRFSTEAIDQVDAFEKAGLKASREMLTQDSRYLLNIKNVINDLRRKYKEVRQLEELDRDAFLQRLESAYGIQISPDSVKDIDFGPVDVVITMLKPYVARDFDAASHTDRDGEHFSFTPVSLIYLDKSHDDHVALVRHERMHNFLDGVKLSEPWELPSKRLGAKLDNINRHNPVDRQYGPFATQLTPEAEEYQSTDSDADLTSSINDLQEELLAELEASERQGYVVTENREPDDFEKQYGHKREFRNKYGRQAVFDGLVRATSTAGKEAARIKGSLDRINQNEVMPWALRQKAGRQAEVLRNRYIDIVLTMKVALQVARQVGPEAAERVHAMLFLLKPSEYRNIPMLLDDKYPESSVKELFESKRFAEATDLYPLGFTDFTTGSVPERIFADDARTISEKLALLEADLNSVIKQTDFMPHSYCEFIGRFLEVDSTSNSREFMAFASYLVKAERLGRVLYAIDPDAGNRMSRVASRISLLATRRYLGGYMDNVVTSARLIRKEDYEKLGPTDREAANSFLRELVQSSEAANSRPLREAVRELGI